MNQELCVLLISIAICSANQLNPNAPSSVFETSNPNPLNDTGTDVVSELNPTETITDQFTTSEIETTQYPNIFEFNGTKYYFNTETKKNFIEANRYCRNMGMGMKALYINSEEENDWIASKIKEIGFGNEDFWTGGSRYHRLGTWNYFDVVTFTNWADGEPTKKMCILLTASTDFKWSSRYCYFDSHYFICKESSSKTKFTFNMNGMKFEFEV